MKNILFGKCKGIGAHGSEPVHVYKNQLRVLGINTSGLNLQHTEFENAVQIGALEPGEAELRELLKGVNKKRKEKNIESIIIDVEQTDYDRLPDEDKQRIDAAIKETTGVKFAGLNLNGLRHDIKDEFMQASPNLKIGHGDN